ERGSGLPWHLPVSVKTPEVVESYVVYQRKRAANALDPPGIARLLEDIPAVEGVAPELAGGAEGIGGDSGHNQGPPPLVKREELWMRPDVSAVVRDEDRQVAKDGDVMKACCSAYCLPLSEEHKLRKCAEGNLVGEVGAGIGKGVRLATSVGRFPLNPSAA